MNIKAKKSKVLVNINNTKINQNNKFKKFRSKMIYKILIICKYLKNSNKFYKQRKLSNNKYKKYIQIKKKGNNHKKMNNYKKKYLPTSQVRQYNRMLNKNKLTLVKKIYSKKSNL